MSSKVVSLMQPYFFPYLGFFELVSRADVHVHYGTASFSKNGWTNRNRVSDGRGGWTYFGFSVLKSPLGTPIDQIRLADKARDKKRLLGLLMNYRRAPYFTEVAELVESVIEMDTDLLCDIAVASVEKSAVHLGLGATFRRSDDLDVDYSGDAQSKVLAVCRQLEATSYVNLSGGRSLYDERAFTAVDVELTFTSPEPISLPGRPSGEVLSVIDTMMFNSPATIKEALTRGETA